MFVPQQDTAILPAGQNRHWEVTIASELNSLLENVDIDRLEALAESIMLKQFTCLA